MTRAHFLQQLAAQTEALKDQGLFKTERLLQRAQADTVQVQGRPLLNFCANNYLGLANHPALVAAAKQGLDSHGFGMASVRFICGTQDLHTTLEARLSRFLGMDDTILYSSCFDANGGLFETLLDEQDAVVSDALNHASIIDGVRLCKARRFRYANNDMADLEAQLVAARAGGARHILIATDGVFSMDGVIARLGAICDLADRYDALVMVDDSHAVGFVGAHGRGTHELCGVIGRVDILTGTLGKALGGASGGYVAASKEVVGWLRQRSRPYLFSNSLAPSIAQATLAALEVLETDTTLRAQLWRNVAQFRAGMTAAGFTLAGQDHAIIPVMLGDAKLASRMAELLLDEGIYVVGFAYPVVPKGQARIRTQMSESTMLALAKLHREPGIWQTRVPLPTPGHNDLLIKISKTAICGTDVHIYKWDEWSQATIPVPMVVGHEYMGTVVGMGSEVRGFALGDRVSGEGHITCGYCRNCRAGRVHLCRNTVGVGVNRQGSFAEYLTIPAYNAFKLPANIPDRIAAIFDPFGNAVHTALSFDLVGEDVLITGAGPIGIMAAAVARHVGARHVVVTDVNPCRLALATTMGARCLRPGTRWPA